MRLRRVGFVFQNLALFPHLNTRQNVAYGLAHLGTAERQQRVDAMLDKLKIDSLADRSPQTLSGGEQQRVALARALVTRPRMLLLDEPLSALDLSIKRSIVADLQRIDQECESRFFMSLTTAPKRCRWASAFCCWRQVGLSLKANPLTS